MQGRKAQAWNRVAKVPPSCRALILLPTWNRRDHSASHQRPNKAGMVETKWSGVYQVKGASKVGQNPLLADTLGIFPLRCKH